MSRVAAGVAAVCAIGAVATVAVMVKGGPSWLMQRGIVQMRPVRGMVPMQAVGQRKGEEPVYYVPMKKVKSKGSKASPLQLATKQQPVVYYYMPETKAAMHSVHHQMLANDTGNATAGGGDDAKLVCTVDNIKALSATVQTKWDACKAHADYKEPNKGASRRLLGWVWEPSAGEAKTAVPKHVPGFYRHQMLANDTAGNDTAAAGGGGDGPSFDDCQKEAAKEACASIASCEDPVCDNYYNEPEIEALCGMCTMAPLGCFAHSAEVYIQDKGAVKVGDLRIGDRVLAASTDGKPISSEVIFMHDHRDASTTVQIYVAEDMMELTPAHMVAIHTEACGLGYCSDAELVPAKEIRAGDKIYVSDGASTGVQTVNAVTKAISKVRYVVTSDDTMVVNGVVASVFSTGANGVETLPFHLLHKFANGALQWGPIAAALEVILESPALRSFEAVVNALAGIKSVQASAAAARMLATPQMSY